VSRCIYEVIVVAIVIGHLEHDVIVIDILVIGCQLQTITRVY